MGQVPFEANEVDLWGVFCSMGNILELVILRTPQGKSKGCAFVTYETRCAATPRSPSSSPCALLLLLVLEEIAGQYRERRRRRRREQRLPALARSRAHVRALPHVPPERREMAEKAIRQLDGQVALPEDPKQRLLIVKYAGPGGSSTPPGAAAAALVSGASGATPAAGAGGPPSGAGVAVPAAAGPSDRGYEGGPGAYNPAAAAAAAQMAAAAAAAAAQQQQQPGGGYPGGSGGGGPPGLGMGMGGVPMGMPPGVVGGIQQMGF